MAPNSDFRENPLRSVYVTGEIDQSLVDRLQPQIHKLRTDAPKAITAYIDSPGGYTYASDLIHRLLKTTNQEGVSCRLITVVTGTAASAAADLLVAGDYVLAYPHSSVIYHGTRRLSQETLTREVASFLAEDLRSRNETFAIRLADRCIDRVIFQFMMLRDGFDEVRESSGLPNMPDAECFFESLKQRLRPALASVIEEASKLQKKYQRLDKFARERFEKREHREGVRRADMQADLIRDIVDFELQENPDDAWSFTRARIIGIQDDFALLADYHSEHHSGRRKSLAERWGLFFLSDEEKGEHERQPEDARAGWLVAQTADRLHSLWYFYVSVCRLLQEGEHNLTATDAYWMGLVDEIVGDTDFPCLRALVEGQASPPATGETATPEVS